MIAGPKILSGQDTAAPLVSGIVGIETGDDASDATHFLAPTGRRKLALRVGSRPGRNRLSLRGSVLIRRVRFLRNVWTPVRVTGCMGHRWQ
jgi:hypothetical protein